MPLRRASETYDPGNRFDGILFQMGNYWEEFVYTVTYAALQDRAAADGDDPTSDLIETFLRHRATIEQIASDLFDADETFRIVTSQMLMSRDEAH